MQRFLKDLREGDVTVYDLLDFVFNSVSLPSVFTCIAEVIIVGLFCL